MGKRSAEVWKHWLFPVLIIVLALGCIIIPDYRLGKIAQCGWRVLIGGMMLYLEKKKNYIKPLAMTGAGLSVRLAVNVYIELSLVNPGCDVH